MTVFTCQRYHPQESKKRFYEPKTPGCYGLEYAYPSCSEAFQESRDNKKSFYIRQTFGRHLCPERFANRAGKYQNACHSHDLKQLYNERATFPHLNSGVHRLTENTSQGEFLERRRNVINVRFRQEFPTKLWYITMLRTDIATDVTLPSKLETGMVLATCSGKDMVLLTEFDNGLTFCTEFVRLDKEFSVCVMFHKFMFCLVYYATLYYVRLLIVMEIYNRVKNLIELCTRIMVRAHVSTRIKDSSKFSTLLLLATGICIRIKVPSAFRSRVLFPSGLGSYTNRTVGRRKQGKQKSGKQKKNGSKYGRKNESERSRSTSQGNGSSGIEGSGEGSGNGDDSSDDDDDGDGDDEDQDDEDDDDEDDDEEEEMDTDNVSAMAEDEAEDTTNGGGEEVGSAGSGKVTSTTLEIHTTGIKDDVGNEDDQDTMTSLIAPVESGTPVTLSGVIWKETMGGVLVVNLKWRNKTYSGSLIDHSRYGWANPRNLDEPVECELSTSSRSSKGKKTKHKESAYTGNPLSPKMSGNGKRGSRFHRNKGKHSKESSTKSKAKRGSDTAEEGTRTRRRSCTTKPSVFPSSSPTPLIECPEKNCNKRYKQISGLRYHQDHAHRDNAGDNDDKDSFDEDDMKSSDFKEPLSANSKSSGSDDVKPLSHRKAKNQKSNSKAIEVSPSEVVQNGEKLAEPEETEDKYDVTDMKIEDKFNVTALENEVKYDVTDVKTEDNFDVIKVEPEPEPMKVEESTTAIKPNNILEEAVKIIFDEPAATQDFNVPTGIFSRMTSQALLAASNPPEYKYVGYEAMDQTVSEYDDKAGGEAQELDVTVKEEVIDEGHAGEGKVSCKDDAEITIKLENAEMPFNGAKSCELPAEDPVKSTEQEKTSKSLPPEKAGKSRKGDGASVAKDQMKTSAADIRLLPGYKHFRLPPNNPGFLTQTKSLTLETGLLESKDPQKGGMPKETPRQERPGEKAKGNSVEWKIQGAASTSSASFQLKCESKSRPGYMTSSRKSSVVTANTTWFPAVSNKISSGGVLPGQEILPEKPDPPREAAETIPRAHETSEEQEEERTREDKGDDERSSKGSYSGKPARAVGVAHPFNAEKSEGEFALGMVGSITTDPVRVLYAKSSSPKMSVDVTHPDMTEVKKVRVEKTLEVPIGEVVPLNKNSRSTVCTSTARGSVMVGGDARGNFSDARGSVPEERLPQIITSSPPPREPQQPYMSSSVERSSPWRPSGSHSPLREHEPRSRSEAGQQYTSTETYASRKPIRRSPVPDHRSSPFRGGYLTGDIGRRTPEKDYPHRPIDKRMPFCNMDERLGQKDSHKGVEVARNSPGKDIPGGSYFSRSDSPRKDTPGTFHHRLSVGYKDSERGSPFGGEAMARRQYDKSPIRDRRSPTHARRSPEVVERPSFRDTSPNPMRDTARHSLYRERAMKQPGEGEVTAQRKDSRSPVGESRTVEVSRGYRMKPDALTTKESGDDVGSQRPENRFPRMTEEEAMMVHARNTAIYHQLQAAAANAQDGNASREAMEHYMMYLSRMPHLTPGIDPRLYPAMLTAAQMPLLLQSAKENTASKDERLKEAPEDIRGKTQNSKSDAPKSRGEASDVEVMANKRYAGRTSSSREKTEYESVPSKRSKTSEMKDVHEIIDEREGGKMQLKALEQRILEQRMQHKMDALNQLQTEKNLKLRAEERLIRSKPSSSSSTSRLKPTMQESRTVTKREEKGFSKEEKSRLSPVNAPSQSSNTSESSRSRNPENKSPLPPSSAAPYLFAPTTNLPANHALSNSYEQALAMQGYPHFLMPFHYAPGMMMANPALVPGGQLHSAVAARGLDPKRDHSRSTSSSSDRARPRDEEGQDKESRSESRDFSSKKETGAIPRINPPTSPPMEKPKEKPRGEYEEGKQRRDTPSLHGSQTLPANLAYRRADMSGGGFDPAQLAQPFPGMMYPGPQGTFRPAYEHSFMSHQRK